MYINYKKQQKAQILVVILIALAILSVFVVVIATNARRDFIESTQNRLYEQALTLGESKLVLFANGDIEDDCGTDPKCEYDGDAMTYTYTGIKHDEDSLDTMNVIVSQSEEQTIENLVLEKDRSATIKLRENMSSANQFDESLEFTWTDTVKVSNPDTNTILEFSVDYISATEGEYTTVKRLIDPSVATLDNNDAFILLSNFNPDITPSNPDTLTHAVTLDLTNLNTNTLIAIRIKALMPDNTPTTSLSVSVASGSSAVNYPNQVLVAIAETYSTANGQPDTPFAILELQRPLHDSPLEILDYVLRSQGQIVKELATP